jgi:hypothetical protein
MTTGERGPMAYCPIYDCPNADDCTLDHIHDPDGDVWATDKPRPMPKMPTPPKTRFELIIETMSLDTA